MNWWLPHVYKDRLHNLKQRSKLINAVRDYFNTQDFLEVETPALQVSPGLEPHLHAFKTQQLHPDLTHKTERFLHTSPEFAMKKLLVAGLPRIYQICHVFRNAEDSSHHSCEFTMIEWYRANQNYHTIMQDCENLLKSVAKSCKIDNFEFKGRKSNPNDLWQYITVNDAFKKYANIDLESVLNNTEEFYKLARLQNGSLSADSNWDDIFFQVFLEVIEPNLGIGAPTILYDYPIHMAALSRPKQTDPRYAERFEMYVCGLELANAFGELTNADIQQQRFEQDIKTKKEVYGEAYPIDPDFIKALEHGMPESSGIALGIDRLTMLVCNADNIESILWHPKI